MNLTKPMIECLKEIDRFRDYPSYWKPKTREKLEALGLVEDRNKDTRYAPASYQLTQAGKDYLDSIKAA